MALTIRPYVSEDAQALTDMLLPVFRAGDTYTVDTDISPAEARAFWTAPAKTVFMAQLGDDLLGTYYIRRNQDGGGAHVCNCGFVTADAARGKGVARAMLAHSLDEAKAQGYAAMQFNFVVSTNTRAIAIWEQAGFETVGRLPGAFRHPEKGQVDALVLFKTLA